MTWREIVLVCIIFVMVAVDFWAVRIIRRLVAALNVSGEMLDMNTDAINEAAKVIAFYQQREKADLS